MKLGSIFKKQNIVKRDVFKKKKLTANDRKSLISWLFLMPSLLGVLLFFVAPFCVVIYYSFINNPIQKVFVGFNELNLVLFQPELGNFPITPSENFSSVIKLSLESGGCNGIEDSF